MNKTEFDTEMRAILTLCALARLLKITEMLVLMRRLAIAARTFEPIKYREGLKQLEWREKCAQAALLFQQTVNQIAADPKYFQPGEKLL